MPIYSCGVTVHATAYVQASDSEEAAKLVKTLTGDFLHVSGRLISGVPFDDPDFPYASLSPAMTIGEPEHAPELVE